MNILYEHDWRIDPLYAVIVGIDAGLQTISKRIGGGDGFDEQSALEYAEPLLGLGFVAAQAYALGTWTDLNRIRASRNKPKIEDKMVCYRCDPIKLGGKASRIEAINAVANYFKHHDEWDATWPTNKTTKTLRDIGITEATEFPCIKATELFCKSWEFVVIQAVVKEWREHVLKNLA